ncbi:MAG TPA: hypothetical protein VGG61_09500, partial [Gemmataceae bacterium]
MNDVQVRQEVPWLWLGGLTLLGVVAVGAGMAVYLTRGAAEVPPDATPPEIVGDVSPQVHQFCGACHAYPPPDTFPRSVWKEEIEQGYKFFGESSLRLTAPSFNAVVDYY